MGGKVHTGLDVRSLALDCLLEISENGGFSHRVLGAVLSKYQYMSKKDRAFLTRLVEGTLDYRLRLDYVTDLYSKIPVSKQKPVIRELLRLSVYQILFMDSVPDRAAVNEAVRLSKKRGFQGLSGLVNAVLRRISADRENLTYPERGDIISYLSVMYSVPGWIVEDWISVYGNERTEEMLQGFLERQALSIRVNRTRTDAGTLKGILESEGVSAQSVPGLEYALRIDGYDHIEALPEFREGLFWVQDISSMRAAEISDAREGSLCIDACAAPGGKSFCLAESAGRTGKVIARDLTPYKTGLIEDGAQRLGFSNLEVQKRDARDFDETLRERADVVLADLPCSGLGVLGKKPDIKYRIDRERIDELARLQREILDSVQAYVKPGGVLVYSTCTISRAENEDNADWFASGFPFKEEERLQLLPGHGGGDGFFAAKFRRL